MAKGRGSDRQSPAPFARYIAAYLDHLRARNYAEVTVVFKTMSLAAFTAWCHERGIMLPSEVTRPILQRYQRHLYHLRGRSGRPLSAASQLNRLMAIKGFFRFLTRENVLLYNPASELDLPRLEKRLPRDVLSASEAERVLQEPDLQSPLGVRDRAILELLYSTGMRRMELVDLERRHIDATRGIIAIRQGKGKRDRFVPVGARALLWLEKYLTDVRADLETTDIHTLFLDEAGCKLDPNRLSRAVRTYIAKSGVTKSGCCHLFRHTMATLMLENGADIRFIQQMLGHAHLASTEVYTHVSILKLKQVHDLTHPARLKGDRTAGVEGADRGSGGISEGYRGADDERGLPTAADVLAALDEEAAEEDADL